MSRSTSRARLAVSAAVTAGLCLTGTAGLVPASQAAPGSCDPAFPVADLIDGQTVSGLTVTHGTGPTGFSGSIIGVLHDGIEPGVDMVMAKLSSTEIQDNGIWAGMSGSPVYDEGTDTLIGAVAYTLSYGETQVAGITPWEDMQAYAGSMPTPLHLQIPRSAARTIARTTSVTLEQASQGFTEVATPQLVSGLPQRVLNRAWNKAGGRDYLTKGVSAAGQTPAGSVTAADMVAGGNLVATASTGDIVQGGLGTITSVCSGRVVGFGHPMNFVGKATYGLAGADALYIQGDPLFGSYKVANIGDVLGTIDQDRMTGISGPLGLTPPSTPITSTLGYKPDGGPVRARTGSSEVQLPEAAASTAFYELLANHQTVLDAYQPGSEEQSWTVDGHTATGPFHFAGSNLYTDTYDIAFGSVWDLPDLLWLLTNVDGVTVDSVDVHSDVTDDTTILKLSRLQQRRSRQWHNVDKQHPARVKAGGTLTMRLVFAGGTSGRKFSVDIPARAHGMRSRLFAQPAESYPFERSFPHRLAGVRKLVHTMQRNDQSQIVFTAFGKRRPVRSATMTPPQGTVIEGRAVVKVLVS
jgi:hypothetical protein